MITADDQTFLRRAMRLAMNGRGNVEPNPMVGCVLVRDGQIIGEGWHAKVGEAHAEPNALLDCRTRGHAPGGATAYVTLEPCCHTNKRTPPCAPRLIEARIARVVVGCLDPNPDVNGKGVAMLRAAGIEVEALPDSRGTGFQPVTADESRVENPCHELDASPFRQLIAPFARRATQELPYVTMKWAETTDGTVSGPGGTRLSISNAAMNRIVHGLRTRCDSIVVGVNTVLCDNPMLTPRGVPVVRTPRRFVLDTRLRTPLDCRLVRTALEVPTTILSSVQHRDARKAAALRAAGVVVEDDLDDDDTGRLSLSEVLYSSLRQDVSLAHVASHVLVEAGPTLAEAMLPITHRLWVIRSSGVRSPLGRKAATVPAYFTAVGSLTIAGDTLAEYLNTRSPAFFAAVPSADFVLAAESAARAAN